MTKRKLSLKIYSTYFTVRVNDNLYKSFMREYVKRFLTYTLAYDVRAKRYVNKKGKQYFSFVEDEYRFPINNLKHFIIFFKLNGMEKDNIEYEIVKMHNCASINIKINEDFVLHKYQKKISALLKDTTKSIELVDLQTGKGKALEKSSKVKTPDGWRPIGSLKVNDLVVGRDGNPVPVTGVYPQGTEDLIEVEFIDGRKMSVSRKHMWKIYINNDITKPVVTDTMDVYNILSNNKTERVGIDLCVSEFRPDFPFAISPEDYASQFYSLDDFDYDYVYSSSRIQREVFLKTLLEIDHSLELNDSYIINYINDYQRLFLEQLLWSMGGVCLNTEHTVGNSLVFTFKNVFNLEIKDMKFIGQAETVCISVDNEDKQFVTEDYVVSHNTLVGCNVLCGLNKRTIINILPMYIDKWIADLLKNTNIDREDILIVKGSKQVKKLIKKAKKGKVTAKVIIFSNTTLYYYIRDYEDPEKEFDYGCKPQDLTKLLKVGTMLVDEIHQGFYSVYKTCLYFNVHKVIALSATLETLDKNLNNQYLHMIPMTHRIKILPYDKYVKTFAVEYGLNRRKIFLPAMYSHTAYEDNIIKSHEFVRNYLKMIEYYVKEKYLKRKKPGQKIAIFAASKEMCTIIRDYLRNNLDKTLTIERYIDEDPYENIIEPDIRVTTVMSGGTAIDIPNLISVFQTINILSPASNKQSYGRLRKIPNEDVEFYYFWCNEVKKHREYHQQRTKMIGDISFSFNNIKYHDRL